MGERQGETFFQEKEGFPPGPPSKKAVCACGRERGDVYCCQRFLRYSDGVQSFNLRKALLKLYISEKPVSSAT